jgi:hypothetical protein
MESAIETVTLTIASRAAVRKRVQLFDGTVDGRLVVSRSTQPLFHGARVLLAEGADPARKLVMPPRGATAHAKDPGPAPGCQNAGFPELKLGAGKKQGAQIAFETPELLFEVMTTKRWEIVRALTGTGPVSLREAARRVGRDLHAVHRNIHALLNAGVLRKTDEGRSSSRSTRYTWTPC